MSDEDFALLVAFFKALAEESRLKIVGVLARGEATVNEIAELLGLTAPTVSHHLSRLRAVGLVTVEARGTTRVYRLSVTALEEASKRLLGRPAVETMSAAVDEEHFEQKVLATFVDGERLRSIPASRRKRDVVLRWLVTFFEPDTDYTEREVSERIHTHHEDFATLRRELVGAGWMTRERGIYRRV